HAVSIPRRSCRHRPRCRLRRRGSHQNAVAPPVSEAGPAMVRAVACRNARRRVARRRPPCKPGSTRGNCRHLGGCLALHITDAHPAEELRRGLEHLNSEAALLHWAFGSKRSIISDALLGSIEARTVGSPLLPSPPTRVSMPPIPSDRQRDQQPPRYSAR